MRMWMGEDQPHSAIATFNSICLQQIDLNVGYTTSLSYMYENSR